LTGSPFINIAVVSYLLGSIPFGYLLVRTFRGQDVRQTGSGNIGATNVARTGSKGLAIATLLLDALKGYAAVILAFRMARHITFGLQGSADAPSPFDPANPRHLQLAFEFAALAAFCALLGHMFPIWLRFKGGKGVATALGAFTALAPLAVLVSLLVFIAAVAITRYVSLGSILSAVVLPFAVWWFNPLARTITTMALIVASCLLIIIRHKDNVRRLLAGTENRFR
jgi:glycerol-3-phosphate acyltransferase PlsY